MSEGSKPITVIIHLATTAFGLIGGFIVADRPVIGWFAIVTSLLFGIAGLCRSWVLEEENDELLEALGVTTAASAPRPPARLALLIQLPVLNDEVTEPRIRLPSSAVSDTEPSLQLPGLPDVLDEDEHYPDSWPGPRAA